MPGKFARFTRAVVVVVAAAAAVVSTAGLAHALPGGYHTVDLDFDARVGDCVTLGGTMDDATIVTAACGSFASNYRVIAIVGNHEECVADRDNWYAETVDDVEVGAVCLDIDWVDGGCMDISGEDPRRIRCGEPAAEPIRVTGIRQGTADYNACTTGVGFTYPERRFVVCVEEL